MLLTAEWRIKGERSGYREPCPAHTIPVLEELGFYTFNSSFSVIVFHDILPVFIHIMADYLENSRPSCAPWATFSNVHSAPLCARPRDPKLPQTLPVGSSATLDTVWQATKPVLPEVAHGPFWSQWFFGGPRRGRKQQCNKRIANERGAKRRRNHEMRCQTRELGTRTGNKVYRSKSSNTPTTAFLRA